jgi:hypothetical protein
MMKSRTRIRKSWDRALLPKVLRQVANKHAQEKSKPSPENSENSLYARPERIMVIWSK